MQDLPEHFEENMEKWMKNFLILLTTDSKQLQVEVNVNFFVVRQQCGGRFLLGYLHSRDTNCWNMKTPKKKKKIALAWPFYLLPFIERKRFFGYFHLPNNMWKDEGVLHVQHAFFIHFLLRTPTFWTSHFAFTCCKNENSWK